MTLGRLCSYLDERYPRNRHRPASDKRRRGGGWSIATVRAILKNETYVGRWHFRKTELVKNPLTGHKKSTIRPKEEWIEIEVLAIVDQETFDNAQAQAEINKKLKGHQHKRFYSLGGMIVCGTCGHSVTGFGRVFPNGKAQYRRYQCIAHNEKRYGFRCNCVSVGSDALEA